MNSFTDQLTSLFQLRSMEVDFFLFGTAFFFLTKKSQNDIFIFLSNLLNIGCRRFFKKMCYFFLI